MKKEMKNFTDTYIKIINEDADTNTTEFKDISEAQKVIFFIDSLKKLHANFPASFEKNYEDAVNYLKKHEDETVEEDVSQKDAFLSKIYDLIDTVYQIGVKAGKTGEEINPHEDEEVNDILGSIEADYDDGKAI